MGGSRRQELRRALFWGLVRVVMITFLVTLTAFAVSLFFSIAGVLIVALVRGGALDMTVAYRNVAPPIAITVLIITFLAALGFEVRNVRSR